MTHDLSATLRRATSLMRTGMPGAALAAIRDAFGRNSPPGPANPPAPDTAEAAPRCKGGIIGRGLRETLACLSPHRPKAAARPAVQMPVLPRGASFDEGRFTCFAGSRDYRLYVPASAQRGPAGMVVMLHGCTQSTLDFAVGTGMNRQAEAHGLIMLYPAQSPDANSHLCWNWFAARDQQRDAGEPAIIAAMTEEVARQFEVPRDRIFVAGMSAGAAMAVILGRCHGDLYRAVGAHSGIPYRAATNLRSALAAMAGKLTGETPNADAAPTIVFHGSADTVVHQVNAGRIAAARPAGCVEQVDIGHRDGRDYSRSVVSTREGRPQVEYWQVDGLGHAWSGGDPAASHADPSGPDASAEMLRFFLAVAADRDAVAG